MARMGADSSQKKAKVTKGFPDMNLTNYHEQDYHGATESTEKAGFDLAYSNRE